MTEFDQGAEAPSPRAVLAPHRADALARQVARTRHRVVRLDLAPCHDKSGLLAAVSSAFRFPDWFGHNWDALADSLADLSWLPAAGYLLLVEGYATLAREAPDDWQTFLEILDETALLARAEGRSWQWHLVGPAGP